MAAAKHEEFERLVHAATFLSRDEYKSTTAMLRTKVSCSLFNQPRDIHTSVFSFYIACLSKYSTLPVGAGRCLQLDRHVLSNEASRVKSAILFASTHRLPFCSEVRLSRWNANAIEHREECDIAEFAVTNLRQASRSLSDFHAHDNRSDVLKIPHFLALVVKQQLINWYIDEIAITDRTT